MTDPSMMRGRDLAEEIARMRARMERSERAADGQPALRPVGSMKDVAGVDIAAGAGVAFATHASGLVVPQHSASGPQPIDQIGVHMTAEEILGTPVPLDFVFGQLAALSVEAVLMFASKWLNALHGPFVSATDAERMFITENFLGAARDRALYLLRDEQRHVLVPQGLHALVKVAMSMSGDGVVPPMRKASAAAAMLGLLDALGGDDPDEDEAAGQRRLKRELAANQIFHSSPNVLMAVERFVRRWFEMPYELAGQARVVDLVALYEETTGISLLDVLCAAFALLGAASHGRPHCPPTYFDGLRWESGRLDRALSMFVIDIPRLRGLVQEEVMQRGLNWSGRTLGEFPVVRMHDGSFLVIDQALLAKRLFGMFPRYDITSRLVGADRQMKIDVQQCYEHISEVYALEVVDDIAPAAGGSARRYGEDVLQLAYAGGGPVADSAIDYGSAWVVVEATAILPRLDTVAGTSDKAYSLDLDKLVTKMRQLDATIRNIRRDETRLTNCPTAPNRRFYPVLITTEGFPVNPFTLGDLRDRAAVAGLLVGNDVAPVEVIDLEELEMVRDVQSDYGRSFLDLLAGKETCGIMGNTGMRDYVLRELRLNPQAKDGGRLNRLVGMMGLPVDVDRPGDAGGSDEMAS